MTASLIPTINWTDFQKVAKLGRLKELKSCEVNFQEEYLFTFVNPATPYIRTKAEYDAQLSNSVQGKTVEEILKGA